MTMKICVISNSHVASVKMAWDAWDPATDVDMTFFAAPRRGMARLRPNVEQRRLDFPKQADLARMVRKTCGGLETIALDLYDVVWLHGLDFRVPRLDHRMSSAVQAKALDGALNGSSAHVILEKLRTVADTPVVISPEPLLADVGLEFRNQVHHVPETVVPYAVLCERIEARGLPEGARYLWQAPDTMGPQMNTLRAFSEGSERTEGNARGDIHKDMDVRHMNQEYGRVLIGTLLDLLATPATAD